MQPIRAGCYAPVPLLLTLAASPVSPGWRCMVRVCVSQGQSLCASSMRSSGSSWPVFKAPTVGRGTQYMQFQQFQLSLVCLASPVHCLCQRKSRSWVNNSRACSRCPQQSRLCSNRPLPAGSPVGDSSRSRTPLSWASRGSTVIMLLMLLPSCVHAATPKAHTHRSWMQLHKLLLAAGCPIFSRFQVCD